MSCMKFLIEFANKQHSVNKEKQKLRTNSNKKKYKIH